MKKPFLLLTCFAFLTFASNAFAAEQTITLKDGSVIKGELTAMSNGVYTVKTASMGTAQIASDQIASINAASTGMATGSTTALPTEMRGQIDSLQQGIMANPALMQDIQALAADPEVMRVLTNPAMMQAIMSKDVNAIQSNPATSELINNPKFQALIRKIQESSNQQ